MLSHPSLRFVPILALLAFAAGCDRREAPLAPPRLDGVVVQSGGGKIAFTSNRDVNVMNDDGTGVTRLTIDNAAFDEQPAWSPTCDRIAFTKDPSGNVEVYVMNADGTGATRLTNSVGYDRAPAWSPDGTKIAFSS